MSVLDELRERLISETRTCCDHLVTAAFDAFEAAHPGLADYTGRCCNCGAPLDPEDGDVLYLMDVLEPPCPAMRYCAFEDWHLHYLCPECAKEARP